MANKQFKMRLFQMTLVNGKTSSWPKSFELYRASCTFTVILVLLIPPCPYLLLLLLPAAYADVDVASLRQLSDLYATNESRNCIGENSQ